MIKHISFRVEEVLRNAFKAILASRGITEQEVLAEFVSRYVEVNRRRTEDEPT